MRCIVHRNVALVLVAASALVVFGEMRMRWAWGIFEVDHPTPSATLLAHLAPLWGVVAGVLPGIIIGIFATRRSGLLGAIAYTLSALVSFYWHGGHGTIAVGNILPEREFIPSLLRTFVLLGALGAAMVLFGTWLKPRLTCVGADTRQRLR
jgi:hypothetical protein